MYLKRKENPSTYLVNPGDSEKVKYQIKSEYGPKYLVVVELMQDKYKKSLVRE